MSTNFCGSFHNMQKTHTRAVHTNLWKKYKMWLVVGSSTWNLDLSANCHFKDPKNHLLIKIFEYEHPNFFVKGDALSLKSWECENYREILFTPLDDGDLFIRCEIAGHAAPRCQAPAGRHPGLELRRGRGSQVNKQWSGQLRLLRGECYLFRHVSDIWRCLQWTLQYYY